MEIDVIVKETVLVAIIVTVEVDEKPQHVSEIEDAAQIEAYKEYMCNETGTLGGWDVIGCLEVNVEFIE